MKELGWWEMWQCTLVWKDTGSKEMKIAPALKTDRLDSGPAVIQPVPVS